MRQKVGATTPTFCRDDPTRTDDPYVPNVVRYQLRYIPIAFPGFVLKGSLGRLPFDVPLCEFVDVNRDAALEVGGLVPVNDPDLREFVNHLVNLREAFLGGLPVCGVTDRADRVPR